MTRHVVYRTEDLSSQADGSNRKFYLQNEPRSNTEMLVYDGLVLQRGASKKSYFIGSDEEGYYLLLTSDVNPPNGPGDPSNPPAAFWIRYARA